MPPGLKRWIVRAHMYLGVAFAALSVMWFASGIVLAYNTFRVLLDADRLRVAPPLDCAACRVSEAEARRVAGIPDHQSTPARLGMLGARPVWRIVDVEEKWHAVFADSAVRVPPVDSAAGAAIAVAFVRRRIAKNCGAGRCEIPRHPARARSMDSRTAVAVAASAAALRRD